jgi:hypothetical protein
MDLDNKLRGVFFLKSYLMILSVSRLHIVNDEGMINEPGAVGSMRIGRGN